MAIAIRPASFVMLSNSEMNRSAVPRSKLFGSLNFTAALPSQDAFDLIERLLNHSGLRLDDHHHPALSRRELADGLERNVDRVVFVVFAEETRSSACPARQRLQMSGRPFSPARRSRSL